MLAIQGSSPSALALPSTCGSLIPSMSGGRWISAERALKKSETLAGGRREGELACKLLTGKMLGQALAKALIYNPNCGAGVCFSTPH